MPKYNNAAMKQKLKVYCETRGIGRLRHDCGGLTLKHHRAYGAWLNMMAQNQDNVCKRWLHFPNFVKDMGDPPRYSSHVARIRKNVPFGPGNASWTGFLTETRFLIDNTVIKLTSSKLWKTVLGNR